jgi:chitinase
LKKLDPGEKRNNGKLPTLDYLGIKQSDMKRNISIVLFTLALIPLFAQPCREVVGYYPGWQWYDRNKLVKPSTIDYSRYTILQYAFMNLANDGHLVITDPWADKNLLLGDINWSIAPAGYDTQYDFGNPDFHVSGTSLSHFAHSNDVKLLMSIGGWTQSVHFPAVTADPSKRAIFIEDCVTICQLYNLDGIDIDWEYPASASEGSQLLTLTQELRLALDQLETSLNRELLITAAISANGDYMQYMPWQGLIEALDIIQLMSYDFYGAWDPLLTHHAPLFAPQQGNPEWTCDAAVQRLLNEHGVPADKITMGIPFYGRTQLGSSDMQLFGSGNGNVDWLHFASDEGTPLYYSIIGVQDEFYFFWDDSAMAPYGISPTNFSFLTFDDTESVERKAEYINEHNLRGAIIWEITGDYIETSLGSGIIESTPLADKINDVFCATPNRVEEIAAQEFVFPNPASDFLYYKKRDSINRDNLMVFDAIGKQYSLPTINMGNFIQIITSSLKPGLYQLKTGPHAIRFIIR